MPKLWNKGRGKLGPFAPLHGTWLAAAESPMGPVRCRRVFAPILGGQYLQLTATWEFQPKKICEEIAVIGVGEGGGVAFWSFTSDGKRSRGTLADVTDLHPEAIGFVAEMPAGTARMAYWPEAGGGFCFVVESKTKKGWNRFVKHSYRAE